MFPQVHHQRVTRPTRGNLFEDQRADLVAAVQEVRRLGIVEGADDVEGGFAFEDVGVAALETRRGGSADARDRFGVGEGR